MLVTVLQLKALTETCHYPHWVSFRFLDPIPTRGGFPHISKTHFLDTLLDGIDSFLVISTRR